jgi:hypothetical protein
MLAQEKQERRLGKALDAGEDAPPSAVVPARTRAVPHWAWLRPAPICKTHM